MRVGVIGAGGQVGSEILAFMSADPQIEMVGICRNEVSAGPLRLAGFDVRCGSVADRESAWELLGDRDVVVNCAAQSGAPVQVRLGQERLLQSLGELPGKKRLIHFSSVAVYGNYIDSRRSTYERPRASAPYGREKRHLEGFLLKALRSRPHEAVILRLGHVYGAGQRLSASVLESSEDPRWRLPFDGRLPSNAIHVRNVAAAIRALILDWPTPGIYNLVDSPTTTWREVFDWHTAAVGTPPVAGMSELGSERVAGRHRRAEATPLTLRVAQETRSWMGKLPASFLSSCPTLKNIGAQTLTALRSEALERTLRAKSQRAAIGQGDHDGLPVIAARLLSLGVSGPQVSYQGKVTAEEAVAIASWHACYSSPDAILEWNRVGADTVR